MPIARFQMPDGRIGRFEVPDGTTPEQAQSMIAAQFGGGDKQPSSIFSKDGAVRNIAAGALKGASDIGTTLLTPIAAVANAIGGDGTMLTGDERRAAINQAMRENANPDSLAFKGGELASDIAGTAGAGGMIAKGVRAIPALANAVPGLATAIESGGFSLGGTPASTGAQLAKNAATRIAGGAVAGGASAGLIDPGNIPEGAGIGAAMPVVGKVAGELGRGAKAAFVDPIINKDQIIAAALKRAVGDSNIPGIVSGLSRSPQTPGVVFSAGEASGSPALNAMEDAFRAQNPGGALNLQGQSNRVALAQPLRDIAQDDLARQAAVDARKTAAEQLYGDALYPANQQQLTPWIKGQITQLLQRPSINQASKEAQKLAMERGEKPAAEGSLAALHDVKTALDDMISQATIAGKGGEVKALNDTKAQLLNVMEKLSPTYRDARITYAQMSRPINQMDVGTVLAQKLLPATSGDIPASLNAATLARALQNPDQIAKTATGFKAAKLEDVLSPDQLAAVMGVNSDASRIAEMHKLGAGFGSPTARRLSTGNYIGQNFEEQAPVLNRLVEALGGVPGVNYLTKGMSAIGDMAGNKINSGMATTLEEMLASDPQGVSNALTRALAQQRPAISPTVGALLRAAPISYRAVTQANP